MAFKRITALILIAALLCAGNVFAAESETAVLYESDFSNMGDWFVYAQNGTASYNFDGQMTLNAAGDNQRNWISTALVDDTWEDYTLETKIKIDGSNPNDRFNIIFNYNHPNRMYAFEWYRAENMFYLQRDTDSKIHEFTRRGDMVFGPYAAYFGQKASGEGIFNLNDWNDIKVELNGNNIKIYVNDTLMIDYNDIEPTTFGGIGMSAYTEGEKPFSVYCKSMKVTGKKRVLNELEGNVIESEIIFSDAFSSDTSKWAPVSTSYSDGASYIIKAAEYSSALELSALADGRAWVTAETEPLNDYIFDIYAKSEGAGYDVIMRHIAVNMYYYFKVRPDDGGTAQLIKRNGIDEVVLAEVSDIQSKFGIDISEWNLLRFRCSGDVIGMFGGYTRNPIITYTDKNTGVLEGKVGVGVTGGTALFDDAMIITGGKDIEIPKLNPIQPIDELDMNHKDKEDNIYAQIYVSPNGSDSNDGTEERPFLTINRAVQKVEEINDTMTGNIIVNIESGTYELEESILLDENSSGKNGYYIIYKSNNGRAKISAGRRITSEWTPVGDGKIWKAPVQNVCADGFREFYVNGDRRYRAGQWRIMPQIEFFYDDPSTPYAVDGLYVDKALIPEVEHPEEIQMQVQISWSSYYMNVKDIIPDPNNEANQIVLFNQPDLRLATKDFYGVTLGTRMLYDVRVEGVKEYLDEPGEYYYDRREKMMYYYPFDNEDLNESECVIPGIDRALNIQGSSLEQRAENIKISGLDFCYTGWEYMTKFGYATEQTPWIYGTDPDGEFGTEYIDSETAARVEFARNIKMEDNTFRNLGARALHVVNGVDNFSFTENVVDDVASDGIVLGTMGSNVSNYIPYNHKYALGENESVPNNLLIKNNIINNVSAIYTASAAIATTFNTNVWILHNEVSGAGGPAITLGWGWNPAAHYTYNRHCVMYNSIKNYAYKRNLFDVGGLYNLSSNMESVVAENHMDNDSQGSVGTIYLDQGSAYVGVYKNVITHIDRGMFSGTRSHDNLFIGNYSSYTGQKSFVNTTDVYVMDTYPLVEGEWPAEAIRVMNNAGIEPEYDYLRERIGKGSAIYTALNRMEAYKDSGSYALKRDMRVQLSEGDDSVTARIINGKLYLPFSEAEHIAYMSRDSYHGLVCDWEPAKNRAVLSFAKTNDAVTILKTDKDSGAWEVNGKVVEGKDAVIVENGVPLLPMETVFELLDLDRKVVYDETGKIAAVCDDGFDIDLTVNKDVTEYIVNKIGK